MNDAPGTGAPGSPGIDPRWTSSAKSGVGTALSPLSRVWFTFSHGILNEVYYPRVDQACTRDFGMIVTDGTPGGFFSEEKRDADSAVASVADGVPSFILRNACHSGRYVLEKHIVTDPRHDVVLQRLHLQPKDAEDRALRLFALLSPHLVNGGANNTGWIGEYKGQEMLFAHGHDTALALAASVPWRARSAGYAGRSDGWRDLREQGRLVNLYDRAADGNVALIGELDVAAGEPVVLALAFGRTWSEAAYRTRASLARGFDAAVEEYSSAWRAWQAPLAKLDAPKPSGPDQPNAYRISTSVLRTHDSPSFPGGIIASLSIPWGASKGDDDLGGYHLVWSRDLVETAGGLMACGAGEDARRVLDYLRAIQEPDGHWPQNTWLDGLAYWQGIQMDESALPVLLVNMARRHGVLSDAEARDYWPMVRRAAGFVAACGPVTGQDRWEENGGYTGFTLAAEITGLLAAAEMAERYGEPDLAGFLRDTADGWNEEIEDWTYVTGTRLAHEAGVEGYYVRVTPADPRTGQPLLDGTVQVRNRPGDGDTPVAELISPDALALVRFGLRRPDDPRIRNTIAVIDRLLKRDLPQGPGWYRYNKDGYGEHADGSPFNGTGIGRVWPLMIGERAHYELIAGRVDEARRLLGVMEACARHGLLPEQVWDGDDVAERELFRGRPSGSAMPLVWAHAEHVKLLRSLSMGTVFDMPAQGRQRYLLQNTRARLRGWREGWQRPRLPQGQLLRVELRAPGIVHWTDDDWSTVHDTATTDSRIGLHTAELDIAGLPAGRHVAFTWRTPEGQWRGENFSVAIV